MAYDYMKRADRRAAITSLTAELHAVDRGDWPRNADDVLRFAGARWNVSRDELLRYVEGAIRVELAHLAEIQYRIEAGELPREFPSLYDVRRNWKGWEP